MAKISQPLDGDAPLSAAKHPDLEHFTDLPNVSSDESLIGRTVSINRGRTELYAFWRDFKNLPVFMDNIRSVEVIDERTSHWVVEGPAGKAVEWDSVITADVPGELIEWQSAEGASVRNSGKVEFLDSTNQRGTIVRVTLAYDPPGGTVGKLVAKLFAREPNIQARRDLRRFKQLMETGEVSNATPPAAAPRS